jgi:phage anti-repressor protein
MSRITLKEFLIKFTAIPINFIEGYYKFYEVCENNKFGIPIENIIAYLGITNQNKIKERIRNNYQLNKDYVIIRENNKLMKGIKDAHYMLAFETFEKICMNSSTKKGQQFRDYFVMLRQFIDYYKQHITDKILDLAKTNKFIYILAVNKASNILKLGRTSDMRKRLQTYSTGKEKHPDVKFIMIVEDDKRVENCAKLFAKTYQYKANKELYKMHNDKLKKIIFNCAITDKEVAEDVKAMIDDDTLDTYILYDDSKTIEYLNLNGDVIGVEKTRKTKTTRQNKSKTKTLKNRQTGGGNAAATRPNTINREIEEINEDTYDGAWDLPIMSKHPGADNKDIIENYFIGKESYKKKHNSHVLWCFHLMLQREHLCSNSDYVVFYHSFVYSHVLFDVQTAIAEIIYNLEPNINRVVPRLSKKPFKDTNIDTIKQLLASEEMDNHSTQSRALLLSAVCSLFAVIEINLISTFTVGYSCKDMNYLKLLKDLLLECNANEEVIDKLVNVILTNEYVKEPVRDGYFKRPQFSCSRNDDCGQMLQLFIHKSILDKITYISEPFGVPYTGIESNCAAATNQVRILVSPEYFMNHNLVKTYRYAANENTHKNRMQFISFLKELLTKELFSTPEKIKIVRDKLDSITL